MNEKHGILFGVLAAIAMSIMAIFVKMAVKIPNETIVFSRFGIPLLLLCLIGTKSNLKFSLQKVPKNLTRALGGVVSMYCYFYAIKQLPLVTAMTLNNTTPLFIPLFVLVVFRKVVSKWRFFAAAVGFIGVIIMLRPTSGFFEFATLFGLGAGFFGAVALLGLRHLSKTEHPQTILFYYFIISSVVTFFPMLYAWQPLEELSWSLLLGIAISGFFYQYLITLAFAHAPATKASIPSYLVVVLSGFADWLIWGKVPEVWTFVGIILICIGGLIAILDKTGPRVIP